MRIRAWFRLLRAGVLLGSWSCFLCSAFAQNVPSPKFAYGKRIVDEAAWVAQAKGSLLVTTGNTSSRQGMLGFNFGRLLGANRLSLEGQVAYGRASAIVPILDPANPMLIVGLDRREDTTTDQWQLRARYDRFFTDSNSGYLLGQIGADRLAGKRRVGGGQAGFSQQVYKSERHAAVAEIGYDFSYESYSAPAAQGQSATQIHSGRIFLGDVLTISADTSLFGNAELLSNLNREHALNYSDPMSDEVSPFRDTRIVGKVGLTTRLWRKLSFAFGLTWKFDQNPATRALPANVGAATFAPGLPSFFADRSDTLTEATLVFSFL